MSQVWKPQFQMEETVPVLCSFNTIIVFLQSGVLNASDSKLSNQIYVRWNFTLGRDLGGSPEWYENLWSELEGYWSKGRLTNFDHRCLLVRGLPKRSLAPSGTSLLIGVSWSVSYYCEQTPWPWQLLKREAFNWGWLTVLSAVFLPLRSTTPYRCRNMLTS